MSFANNVKITLNAAITSSATSVQVVKAISPFNDPPTSGKLTLMDSLSSPTQIEIIAYTGRTDNSTYWTLTGVSRGQESTTAAAFSSGDSAVQTWTAGQADQSVVTYKSETITASKVLDENTNYLTGSDLVIESGVVLTLPTSSDLTIETWAAQRQL